MRIAIDQIEARSRAALQAHGAGPWQAAEVAKAVARAEAVGNVICGLYYLESYCIQLTSGRVDGRVEPLVHRPRPGSVTADARFGFAQPAFARALPVAVAAARANGIAALAVAHSHTCTSLGYFTEQIAAEGLIGFGVTNASAIVAGPGGKRPTIGTNPLAVTVPGRAGIPRLHADFSTAAVALGKITMAKAAGETIPLGWAVDAEGKPTTDPEAALGGALVSAADYKGWALGLMVEMFAAALTGSVTSKEVKGLKLADGPPHDLGQFYILIDPGAQTDRFDAIADRIAAAVAQDAGARMPGARARGADSAEVPDALWQKVLDLSGG